MANKATAKKPRKPTGKSRSKKARVAPPPPAIAAPRKMVIVKIRPNDDLELPLELDLDSDIPYLLRQALEVGYDLERETARYKRAKAARDAANARAEQMAVFTEDRFRAYAQAELKAGRGKGKHVDIGLSGVYLHGITARLSLRAQQLAVVVEDERSVIEHFTKGIKGGDEPDGHPVKWVPGCWVIDKTALNKAAAVNRTKPPPGVYIEDRPDKPSVKEVP